MTRQPTTDIGIFLFMAFDAHPHLPVLIRQPLQIFDLTVTFAAGNLAVDMSLMIEQYMFGHIVYFDPRGGGLRIEILVLFLNPGVSFYNIVMAVQALFHRGDAREI